MQLSCNSDVRSCSTMLLVGPSVATGFQQEIAFHRIPLGAVKRQSAESSERCGRWERATPWLILAAGESKGAICLTIRVLKRPSLRVLPFLSTGLCHASFALRVRRRSSNLSVNAIANPLGDSRRAVLLSGRLLRLSQGRVERLIAPAKI